MQSLAKVEQDCKHCKLPLVLKLESSGLRLRNKTKGDHSVTVLLHEHACFHHRESCQQCWLHVFYGSTSQVGFTVWSLQPVQWGQGVRVSVCGGLHVCVCTPEHGDRESLSSQSSARNFSGRGGGGGVEGLRPTKLPSTPQVTYLQWSARGQLAGPSPFICIFISFHAASFPVFDVAGQDPYSIRIISSCLACHSRCLACLAKHVHLISAWHFRYHHHYQHRHCHPV